jgi:hypothetical protein
MNKDYFSNSLLGILAFVQVLLGQVLIKSPLKSYTWILFLGAVAAFLYSFRNIRVARLSLQPKDPEHWFFSSETMRTGMLVFSVIITIISYLLFNAGYNPLAWLIHILGIVLFVGVFVRLPKFKLNLPEISVILLIGILLLAGVVRFWQVGSMPFGTWYDEAFNGNLALRILQEPAFRPIFFEADTLPSHLAYLFALSFKIFGASTAAMRYVTAAFGVVTVLFAYLLFRRWFNSSVGLMAALLFAVMRYDLTLSRIAMHGVTTPAFELVTLYFLDRALERKQFADFAWLGLAMGLGLAFYTPFLLFALIILSVLVLIFVVNVWRQHILKRDTLASSVWDWQPRGPRWEVGFAARLGILLIGMLIAFSPVIQFAMKNPQVFTARSSAISIFEQRDEPDLTQALWNSTVKHLLMFNWQGDQNGRHNWPGEPMLDPIMGALFVLGLGHGLWRWRDPPNFLMLLIFFGMILPGILSVDFEAPQSLRSVGVIPALVYFSVLPVALLAHEMRRLLQPFDGKRGISIENSIIQAGIPDIERLTFLSLGFIALFAAIAFLNINTYFNKQIPASDAWAHHSAAETLVSNEMLQLSGEYDFILSAMYENHPTVKFLAGNVTNYQRWTASDRLPLVRPNLDRGVVMLLDVTLSSAYDEARRIYPNAEFIEHRAPTGGGTVLYEVVLAPDDLRAVSGVVARYFPRNSGQGEPVKEEILSHASVDWTGIQPLSGEFIATLSSTLYAPEYGSYQFSVSGATDATLWIDEFIVNDKPVLLARGNHALRLQVPSSNSIAEVWWQPPGTTQQEPVPGAFLFRPPVTNNGLLGAYYPSPDWSSDPAFMQIDPEIAFYFHIIPLPRPYTVEWTGKIFAPAEGDYHFALNSVDGSQLILGDEVVVDNPDGHTTVEGVTSLTEGWHDITVRFSDQTSATQIYLYWMPPGAGQLELVPTRNLLPPMGKYPLPSNADH